MTATIFKNIFDKTNPYYIEVDKALDRIKTGKSKEKVLEIRSQIDKDRANKLKCNLPSVCFSGKFSQRGDGFLIEHSGFLVLDIDECDVQERKKQFSELPYCYACWVSPSGNGIKMLVKIADRTKHRLHFSALKEQFPEIDKSGVNESRVCYESWDENIFINTKATIYKKTLKHEFVEVKEKLENQSEIFEKILKWLSNKGDAFVTGERNSFIFKLASACCRFGIWEENTLNYCNTRLLSNDNTFSVSECQRTIKSAYKANSLSFGNAVFEKDKLVDKKTLGEVSVSELNPDIYDFDVKPKDVIFGEDVKEKALKIWENGYEGVESTGVAELDYYFKFKKGEATLLSGIGNYGKSSMLKFLLVIKAIKFDNKFALFAPEDNPAEEFYHDLVEIYLGCDCTKFNPSRPSLDEYNTAYDWVSKRFFYIFPKDLAPTPIYIKERFLELIIKEKVDGCIIDPFNQLANDYGKRSDKYLESFLSDFGRFVQLNNVYGIIIAHPHKMVKDKGEKSYPCPDVYDIADGAMWNNKMDNILIYHRPDHQTNPDSTLCELHSKKIRRQKTVGRKGILSFELSRNTRRFLFNGRDYLGELLKHQNKSIQPNEEFANEKIMQYQGDNPF